MNAFMQVFFWTSFLVAKYLVLKLLSHTVDIYLVSIFSKISFSEAANLSKGVVSFARKFQAIYFLANIWFCESLIIVEPPKAWVT